ncbi:penicillin-binding protein [Acididesulfobacillus acetoxydans]|nr:penicillin-binding transpeptidase domain-containing protein [Acididesulfobacillus acetoxydans]
MVLVIGRLFLFQVVQAAELQAKGLIRRTVDQSLLPARGKIFDSAGHVLAQSMPVKGVSADPKQLAGMIDKKQYTKMSVQEIAGRLAGILGQNTQSILTQLEKTNLQWVSLAHQVNIQKAEEIARLKIPGITFSDEEERVYPMGSVAASALGIVDMAGHGVEGIEAYYDKDLYGTPGFSSTETDTGRQSVVDASSVNDPPIPGDNLTLTLDPTIQYLIDQNLDILEAQTKAKNVTIIAMDPKTGKILGLDTRPSFDPNHYTSTTPEQRKDRAISKIYEPGSTFKIVTGSAALEEGTITPNSKFNDPGYLNVDGRVIKNWDSSTQPLGKATFTQGMERSSNVVLAQVGLKLGMSSFYKYLRAFGFGQKTGVDIAGEESGLLVPQDKAGPVELATMSFGQANMVTPIQLLTAICAVANGGTLYKPYIVDKITTPDGQVVSRNKPAVVRRVISQETATEMTQVLENVVRKGTGYLAAIPGINVAAKTGTAQKVDPKTGRYSNKDYIASFAAYAPAENPKIALLIVIDSPRGPVHDGGPLGGPRAQAILEGALRHFGVPVAQNTQSTVTLPGNTPVRPSPKPVVPQGTPAVGETVVPDLTGLTMRQAGETLGKAELHFNFQGVGLVVRQSPAPGKVVPKGTRVEVKFAVLGQSP